MEPNVLADREKGLLSLQLTKAILERDDAKILDLKHRGADACFPIQSDSEHTSNEGFTPAWIAIKSGLAHLLPPLLGSGRAAVPLGLARDGKSKSLLDLLPEMQNPPIALIRSAIRTIVGCLEVNEDTRAQMWDAAAEMLFIGEGEAADIRRAVNASFLLESGALPRDASEVARIFAVPVSETINGTEQIKPFLHHFFLMEECQKFMGNWAARDPDPAALIWDVPLLHYAVSAGNVPVVQTLLIAGAALDTSCDKGTLLRAGFDQDACARLDEQITPIELAKSLAGSEVTATLEAAIAKGAIDRLVSAARGSRAACANPGR